MIKNQIRQTLRFLQPQLLTLDDVPKGILDTSTTTNTKFDPEAINERIMQGDTTALEELQNEKGVTNFSSKETTFTNNGKTYTQLVVKYTYNGSKYNVICRKEVNAEDVPTTEAEALAKAMKEMGLRATNAQGIYCELHNPNMPAGNYTKQRHYYWDKTNQKMVELPNIYYVSPDGREAKEMIDNYNKTGSVNPPAEQPATGSTPVVTETTTTTSGFNNYTEVRNYIFGNEGKNSVKAKGITDFSKGFAYEDIADTVAKAHEKDFASITKEQLINEFVAEYNKRISTAATPVTPTTETPATTNTDKTEALKSAYKEINKTINSTANWLGMLMARTSAQVKGNFDFDTNGKINLADTSTKNIYNTVIDKIYAQISNDNREDFLTTIGGKDGLTKLVQTAWVMTYSTYAAQNTTDTEKFVNKVMENLQKLFNNLQTNPDNLSYLTDNCYKDSNLTSTLSMLTKNAKINFKNYKTASYDGKYHLSDDTSDKNYQKAMDRVLEKLYNKYPNISKAKIKEIFIKAQGNALTSAAQVASQNPFSKKAKNIDTPNAFSTNLKYETTIKEMVQLVLYKFDQLFKTECLNSTFPAREAETTVNEAKKSNISTDDAEKIKEGAKAIKNWVNDVADDAVANCKSAIGMGNNGSIHTEFGMDSSGNIVFQDADTTKVYNTILGKLKTKISRFASDGLQKLGGETALKQLLQSAWITTYNDFNSSQSNNLAAFVNKVMSNLDKMLEKLQTQPELLNIFTKRSSYADNSVTKDVKHYNTKTTHGNDEKISYKGNVTTYADGTVHISNDDDDDDYQTTMAGVLKNLITKYSSIDEKTITSVFRNAQKQALTALQNNTYDCPYGTGNNGGRVEDSRKNWGGKDNRKGDKFYIDMDQVVQMTLYYFDKLLMKELLK